LGHEPSVPPHARTHIASVYYDLVWPLASRPSWLARCMHFHPYVSYSRNSLTESLCEMRVARGTCGSQLATMWHVCVPASFVTFQSRADANRCLPRVGPVVVAAARPHLPLSQQTHHFAATSGVITRAIR